MPNCLNKAENPTRHGSLCSDHLEHIGKQPAGDSNLVSNTESRTTPSNRDSPANTSISDNGHEQEPEEWSAQQKRVFHRTHTLLSYWDQHGYEVLGLTLTSCPESDPPEKLAYNLRRLRQTVERASIAKDDKTGGYTRLTHINEIEQLVIRTNEGPEGKGVLHTFWAWKPPGGSHSRSFIVPYNYLKSQWGRIHGPHDEHSEQPAQPLRVEVKRHGAEDYHSAENLARYLATQYLAGHGVALENLSWSWERTLGGSVTDAWETVKSLTESVERAVELWHDLLGGTVLELEKELRTITVTKRVHPPPNLGVELVEESVHIPVPEPSEPTIRTVSPSVPEYDPDETDECPSCSPGRDTVTRLDPSHPVREADEHDRLRYRCYRCKEAFAPPGEGDRRIVEKPISECPGTIPVLTYQSRLSDFLDPDDPATSGEGTENDECETATPQAGPTYSAVRKAPSPGD
jgi:hypothetical protein